MNRLRKLASESRIFLASTLPLACWLAALGRIEYCDIAGFCQPQIFVKTTQWRRGANTAICCPMDTGHDYGHLHFE
jgi:hypothetical protein